VDYHDRTPPYMVVETCRDATVIITNKTPISAELIGQCPNLRLISVTATGYNIVDVAAAKANGVLVCNVPEYSTDSVAQHVFALLLELTNRTGRNARSVMNGDWSKAADWCYTTGPIMELRSKRMGIVGFGRIGKRVAEMAHAFGMEVVFFNKGKTSELAKAVSLEDLFSTCDVISLHCPLTPDNEGFVNAQLLARMKPSAILINTARGQLIREGELAIALKEGKLAAAALDVLSKEPPPADHSLIGLENCLVTPHNAWISQEARRRLLQTTLENIERFLEGRPQYVVG